MRWWQVLERVAAAAMALMAALFFLWLLVLALVLALPDDQETDGPREAFHRLCDDHGNDRGRANEDFLAMERVVHALKRYVAFHGHAPADLTSLTPTFLLSVPPCRVGGEQWLYSRSGQRFRLGTGWSSDGSPDCYPIFCFDSESGWECDR